MFHTYKIATLNINGIATKTKMSMLANFLTKQDIDVALLQEVTHNDFTTTYGYTAMVNEGTEKRGTVILVKTGLQLQNIQRIPSGREIAANFKGIRITNIMHHQEQRGEQKESNFSTRTLHTYCRQMPLKY
jgi:exonuclease III